MVTVFDVVDYILTENKTVECMKMQKLVYYAQAWSLAWNNRPIFKEEIQAWINGPMCPDLFEQHRGCYDMTKYSKSTTMKALGLVGVNLEATINTKDMSVHGSADNLNDEDKKAIDIVLHFYGKKSKKWLNAKSRKEDPWRQAANEHMYELQPRNKERLGSYLRRVRNHRKTYETKAPISHESMKIYYQSLEQ
jgi:uncharacterized phage-associated protein